MFANPIVMSVSGEKKGIKSMRQLTEVWVNTIAVLGGVYVCVCPQFAPTGLGDRGRIVKTV